jgi:hypothetical protein
VSNPTNPLSETMRQNPLGRAQKALADLSQHWAEHKVDPFPVPLLGPDPGKPSLESYSEPVWISGWSAFQLFQLQTTPQAWAPAIARICETIVDQVDREENGLNHVFDQLPPTHSLLSDFVLGSNQWFRALYSLLTMHDAEEIDGWDDLVSELYNWIGPDDDLRIRASDVLHNALHIHWSYSQANLPEAKQVPIWSFPTAMAWIATRSYLALARMGVFYRSSNEDNAVAYDGVCHPNTVALGWLHTALALATCKCGAIEEHGWTAYQHCTCISIAWEELVHFNGGLTKATPELVFNIQEGWLSMTWPDGADELRFLRRDILERWPVEDQTPREELLSSSSTTKAESECRAWLAQEFAADPAKRRTKNDFRTTALSVFSGRLSGRGFDHRVWPDLARNDGRDGAGAKKK